MFLDQDRRPPAPQTRYSVCNIDSVIDRWVGPPTTEDSACQEFWQWRGQRSRASWNAAFAAAEPRHWQKTEFAKESAETSGT